MTIPSAVRVCGQHALTLALGMSLALPSAVLAALPPAHVVPAMLEASVVAGAAVRAPDDPKVSVEVLVMLDGPPNDNIIAERLAKASRDALKDEAVELVGAGEGSVVRVSVRWTDDDNHEIEMEVVDGDGGRQVVPGTPFACNDCVENQLLAKVVELVLHSVLLLPEVDSEPVSAADDGGQPADDGTGGDEGDDDGDDDGERERLGGMGKAGVGLIIAGSVATGVGGGLMFTGRKLGAVDAADARMTVETDLRPPGIGVLIGGGVAILSGVALLVVNHLRANRSRVAVLPVRGPSFTGLSVAGRF